MSIYKKLHSFHSKVATLKKDKTNPHFKNSYVDINNILDEIKPVFDELGIGFFQSMVLINSQQALKTVIFDIEDESSAVESESVLVAKDLNDPQKLGSSVTYFRRYHLVSLLGLSVTDDDGKAGSNPVKENKKASEEQVLELEKLTAHKESFRLEWLQFLNVEKFEELTAKQAQSTIITLKKQIEGTK